MFKIFGLRGQVLELRGLLEKEQRENIILHKKISDLLECRSTLKEELRTIKKYFTFDGIYMNPKTLVETYKRVCKDNQRLGKELSEREKINNNNLNIISDFDRQITKLKSKNESYLADLIKYEKEIKELKELNDLKNDVIFSRKEDIKQLKQTIKTLNGNNNEIIRHYLVKKYCLLADQKAPAPLLELIDNLIQEIKI